MRIIQTKLMIVFIIAFCCSCEISNRNKNGVPGFTKMPCANLDQLDVKKYPKIIDSLITRKLVNEYRSDSLFDYRILGNVYYKLSLIDCKIDSSSYNASIEVKTAKKKEYWVFEFEERNNGMKVIGFYKEPLEKGKIPKQYE